MREITLVTSFFNINRGEWEGFQRTVEKYLIYFDFWAGIKNKLIIYTSRELVERISEIRGHYGLADRTTIHIVDDYRDIAPDLYNGIRGVMQNKYSIDFRLLRHVPEAFSADYNYITGLKTWFMADAVNRGEVDDMVSWIDFGYNHGGEVVEFKEDFHFEWTYDFPDKANIFLVSEIIDEPIFETIRRAHNSIGGSVIVCPSKMSEELWRVTKEEIKSLYGCGFSDDDQTIMQMVYKKFPEIFQVHYADWHMPIVSCGGDHMRIRHTKRRGGIKLILVKAYLECQRIVRNIKYCLRTFKSLQNNR